MTYIHSDRFLYHTAPTEHNTLPLHDALPILARMRRLRAGISKVDSAESAREAGVDVFLGDGRFVSPDTIEIGGKRLRDRKSTRLNSSDRCISYAVFCLKKKTGGCRLHAT